MPIIHRIWTGRPLDVLVTAVVATSLVMVGQLVLGVFRPLSAVLLVAAVVGVWVFLFVIRLVWPDRRTVLIILAFGFLALLPRLNPFLYVWGGQDQGIYVAMSSYFGRTQGLVVRDELRAALPQAARQEYDQHNQWTRHGPDRNPSGAYEGTHQPGIYIKNQEASDYVFQFYPLQPLWMALFAELLGDAHRVYAVVFFSLLNILMLSLLAYELAGGMIGAGVLLASLLAVSPIHAFLSRFPVTENVTVFFSATAFYYLVRYFKARSAGMLQTSALLLSGGAWCCLFINHISGFLYGPILAFIVSAGVATVRSRREMLQLLGYGAAVIAAYGMSLWYAMNWSFPYSFDIYQAIFGKRWGGLFVHYWPAWIALACGVWLGGCALIWSHREVICAQWHRHRLGCRMSQLLVVVLMLSLAYGLVEAYRLGFTERYAGDDWLDKVFRLNNGGLNAALHSSVAVLGLYLSPFVAIFLVVMWLRDWSKDDLFNLALLLFIAVFLVVRTANDSFTYYYYYGRYLGGELVPYMLLASSLLLWRMIDSGRRAGKLVAVCIFELGLIWSAATLAMQYPGGEMHRLDASVRPLVRQVEGKDLLILALDKDRFHPLQTALDYYYGINTAFVDPAAWTKAVAGYAAAWPYGKVYALSASKSMPGLRLVMESRLEFDHYLRGRYDVLPREATSFERLVFLHEVPR